MSLTLTQSDLTIIIPAYNEVESLQEFLPRVMTFCKARGHELIVVDDGSTDGTGALLDAVATTDRLQVIRHKVNRGYGGAIKSGVCAATTDYVVTIDADGQHVLEDIERLQRELVARDADMVIGNRDGNRQGAYRRTGKFLIRAVARILLPLHLRDINSGMKLYRTALARRYIRLCPDSMAYSDTIALVFVGRKHRVVETPISLRPRTRGQSSISTRTALTTVIELLNIVVLFNPMRVFLPLAVIFSLAGVGWNVPIFLRGEGVSVGAMLLIVSGLLFFLLGLITEMLSNIRRDQIDR